MLRGRDKLAVAHHPGELVMKRPSCRRRLTAENLEPRFLLAASPFEQAQLEHVNRMRLDPQGELAILFDSLAPLDSPDADVDVALEHFAVNSSALQAQWAELTPAPPLAWNDDLATAARDHTESMLEFNLQAHRVWNDLDGDGRRDSNEPFGEAPLGERIAESGYSFTTAAENVYAYSLSMFYGHSAFVIDWGTGPGGIQDPPGHRLNVMDANLQEVGVSVIENEAAWNNFDLVGPFLITQDFGARRDYAPQVLGVFWEDGFTNGYYEVGEGFGGVDIMVAGEAGVFTTTTADAGGYQIVVPTGTYDVFASSEIFGHYAVADVVVGEENVKVDFELRSTTLVPAAQDDLLSIQRPGRNELNVLGNDGGSESLNFETLTVLRGPEKGSLEIDTETGTVVYNASGCASGDDSFRYRILNDEGYPLQAEVQLTSNHWDQFCGDANMDGVTDTQDFDVVRDNLFTTDADWNSGDFNGDGVVDVSDVNLWNDSKFTVAAAPSIAVRPSRAPQAAPFVQFVVPTELLRSLKGPLGDTPFGDIPFGDALPDDRFWIPGPGENRPLHAFRFSEHRRDLGAHLSLRESRRFDADLSPHIAVIDAIFSGIEKTPLAGDNLAIQTD